MKESIILAGFGGQGILSAGLMIAQAASRTGLNATFFPSYGAEMRGGTANCNVIVSDKPIGSPIIEQSDVLIAFNALSLKKFLPMVKKGGLVLVNSSQIKELPDSKEYRFVSVSADSLAVERIGNIRTANIIMLGAYLKEIAFLGFDEIRKTIAEIFKPKGDKVIESNVKALNQGMEASAAG